MQIGVGSGNPVKRAAVALILEGDIEAVAVDSGVSEQPWSHAETVRGAETRAAAAREAGYDVGVGLEGGVSPIDGTVGLYLIMWAAIDDGTTVGRGAGPSVRLPDPVADRVRNDEELGPVMDDVTGRSGLAKTDGAISVLTNGRIDRTDALASAVAGALGPIETDLYESSR
ncbi:inosine/xanthosine triphosphatase [Halopenitus malekzadehii]|uniref:inosine/xanthosine triphosphatase n=1 Tax=Halopenitus malekzadehii TaxID=1267564 RepID=A0A1H6HWL7_9EURY|nr:inosine/xanthosine triphosphatase [Halopenitus malekzadehii]SEH38538.1 inosine/xanthosine triphosphatase [Halopenitus malekzadehii]